MKKRSPDRRVGSDPGGLRGRPIETRPVARALGTGRTSVQEPPRFTGITPGHMTPAWLVGWKAVEERSAGVPVRQGGKTRENTTDRLCSLISAFVGNQTTTPEAAHAPEAVKGAGGSSGTSSYWMIETPIAWRLW